MDDVTVLNNSTTGSDLPSALCDVRAVVADTATMSPGVLWRLTETGRQLDANLVHLAPRQHIAAHAESDLDVLLFIIAGTGTLDTDDGPLPLTAGLLVWLPGRAVRALTAGRYGLAYLTVHGRRPGMQIGRQPPDVRSLDNASVHAIRKDSHAANLPPEADTPRPGLPSPTS